MTIRPVVFWGFVIFFNLFFSLSLFLFLFFSSSLFLLFSFFSSSYFLFCFSLVFFFFFFFSILFPSAHRNGRNQTNDPTNEERPCTTRSIESKERELSICQSLLAELTRQMTLTTENGHAAPPVESRKSCQSVNSCYVSTW